VDPENDIKDPFRLAVPEDNVGGCHDRADLAREFGLRLVLVGVHGQGPYVILLLENDLRHVVRRLLVDPGVVVDRELIDERHLVYLLGLFHVQVHLADHVELNVVCQHVLDVPHKGALAFVLVLERVAVFVCVARKHRVFLPYLRNVVRSETPAYLVQLLRHYVQFAHV